MNELIKITEKDGVQLINARDLHESLRVGKDFSNWIKDRIEKYGFIQGEDFFKNNKSCSPNLASKIQNSWGGNNKLDYFLTLDMAKELAMVENNEAGRKIRRYLIRVEKKFRELAFSGENLSLTEVNSRLEWIEKKLEGLNEIKSAVLRLTDGLQGQVSQNRSTELDEDICLFYKNHIDDTVSRIIYTKAVNLWELFKYEYPNKYRKAEFMERFKLMYRQFTFERYKNVDVFWGFRLFDTRGVC